MGRPKKLSRYYYKYPVLLDEDTYRWIVWHKNLKEPLGAVVHRLLGVRRIEQGQYLKKMEALQKRIDGRGDLGRSILNDDYNFKNVWNELEESIEAKAI